MDQQFTTVVGFRTKQMNFSQIWKHSRTSLKQLEYKTQISRLSLRLPATLWQDHTALIFLA